MRKKIILGIVILVVLAAIGGAVYFDKNYGEVYSIWFQDNYKERTDVTKFNRSIFDYEEDVVKCTPSLKKFTKLESLKLFIDFDKEVDLGNLSEMNKLKELEIDYFEGYSGRLETLPELPNLKSLTLYALGLKTPYSTFKLADENYNFSNIETLSLYFEVIDFDSLKYFENLKNLYVIEDSLTKKEIEELQSRGINVEIV